MNVHPSVSSGLSLFQPEVLTTAHTSALSLLSFSPVRFRILKLDYLHAKPHVTRLVFRYSRSAETLL